MESLVDYSVLGVYLTQPNLATELDAGHGEWLPRGEGRYTVPPTVPYLVAFASLLTSHPAAMSRPAGNVESIDVHLSTPVGPAVDIPPDPDIVSALTKTRASTISSAALLSHRPLSIVRSSNTTKSDSHINDRKPGSVRKIARRLLFYIEILHK